MSSFRPGALLVLLLALPARAQEPHRALLAAGFQAELERIAREASGVVGASVVDLAGGARFGVNDTLDFPQGSAIKVPLLLELFRQADAGRLRLDERVEVPAAARVGGTGVLQHFGDRSSALSLRDLAALVVVLSDNTATNLLIERVGMDAVNRTLREMGLPRTRLQRLMIRPRDSALGRENLSTPREAADLMARIAACRVPLRPGSCAALRALLEIPKAGPVPAALPPGVPAAWKGGTLTGVETAWAAVALEGRPYALAVMVSYSESAPALEAIRRVVAASHAYFTRLAGATPYGARVDPGLLADTAAVPPPRR